MRRDDVDPPIAAVREAVAVALAEDLLPLGDLPRRCCPQVPRPRRFVAALGGRARRTHCAEETCIQVDPELEVTWELAMARRWRRTR